MTPEDQVEELVRAAMSRDDLVEPYRRMIKASQDGILDIRIANRAIIERWSPAALSYIKRKAWS